VIHIDPLTVALRAFAPGDKFHDPYIWSATGVRIAEGVVEIVGCMEAPTGTTWHELHETLSAAGWKQVVFTRYVNGEAKQHTVDLTGG